MSGTAVLAYSGGLDTSCAIAWLKEDYGFDEVVAVLVDVGQDADLAPALERGRARGRRRRASSSTASRRSPTTRWRRRCVANALYEGRYPLVSALSRPVIAEAVAEVALELGAEAVVHGCTGKGNDQLRFELAFKAQVPGRARDRTAPRPGLDAGRGDRLRARARDPGRGRARTSRTRSTTTCSGGRSRPACSRTRGQAPPEDAFELTASPLDGARADRARDRRSSDGLPVALDGDELDAARARRGAERPGRRVRDRPHRHGREPRRRDQEPRAVRGAGRDHADRGAPRARGARADEGRAAGEARARAALGEARLRRPLVPPAPRRRTTRSSPPTQERVTGEVRVSLQPGLRGRHRPPLRARPLLARSRVLRRPARRSRTRRRRASSASRRSRRSCSPRASGRQRDARHDALGRAGSDARARARGRASSSPRTTPSCSRTTARPRPSTLAGCTPPGCSTTTSSPRSSDCSTASSTRPADEDVHTLIERSARRRRPKDPRRPVAQRPGRGCAAPLRARTRAPRRSTGSRRFARTVLDRAEEEAETPLPGYTHLQRAQPVTVGHHLLAWVEMLERDRGRFRFAAAAGRALAARSGRARRLDAGRSRRRPGPTARNSLDAVADRDFALDYLYACAVLFGHLSRIGEEVMLWVVERVRLRRACPSRRRPAPR